MYIGYVKHIRLITNIFKKLTVLDCASRKYQFTLANIHYAM